MAYIDPVTGAFVADSLDALPPGYNQPKAGNEANVAKMRAAINNGWDDNTPLPNIERPATDPFSLVKHAYQNMPGASFVQGVTPALLSMPQFLASLGYGLGNQAVNPQTANFDADTTRAMRAMQYTPPTQAGRDIAEGISKVGEATGPLPELFGLPAGRRFTPDDLRVAGRTATQDFRNFGSDYANAKAGVQREYPTAGSRVAQFTDVAGDLSRPLAEKAYDMYMNPDRGVEAYGMRPGANLSGLVDAGGPMYAVKPKGGNWPTNLGSTIPLKEQGQFGAHLSSVQYDDPIAVFRNQLEKHYPRGIDNRQLLADFEDYQTKRIGLALDPNSPDRYLSNEELSKKIADEFAELYNTKRIGAADIDPDFNKPLHTASQIADVLPAYNSWIMGPYQKYITNQMGTGLATDPLLQAVNEGGMPLKEIFDLRRDPSDYLMEKGANRRRDFVKELTDYGNKPQVIENTPIGQTTATTPEGLQYENVLDAQLYPKGPYAFKDDGGGTDRFPVVGKLDSDTLITDFLSQPDDETGFPNMRKQVFKDLLAGNIDPAKLSNVTPATITRQMIKDKIAEFKEAQLSKKGAAEWIPKRAAQMPTAMAFDDGSKITIITPEMANADEAMAARDLGQITLDLNQCVGAGCHATQDYPGHGPYLVPHTGKPPRGKVEYDKYSYLKRLKRGDIEIASLKDPEGVSQATIRLDLETPKKISSSQKEFAVGVWLEDNKTPEDVKEFYNNKMQHGIDMATIMAVKKFPELQTRLDNYNGSPKKSITEMKGKDNGDIKEEYIPQMVQWLNSMGDDLTDVRDLNHLPNVGDLTRTYDTIGKIMDTHSHWDVNTVEDFLDKVTDEKLLPRFFTADDFAIKATELGIDLSAEPKKKGTKAIQEAYEKLSQQLRLTYEEPYLQEYINGDIDVINSINNDIYYHANQYGLGGYSETVVMDVVDRLRREGLHVPGRELENVAQQFEAEPAQEWQPERLTQMERDVLDANITDLLDGHNIDPANMVEPYATDMRILMGSQQPEAKLPRMVHQSIINMLLDQDNHTADLRDLMNRLEQGNHFVTEGQAENALNMLISWTERYPLDER